VNIKRPTKGKDQKKNKTREKRDHEEAAEEKPLKRRVREYQGEKCITETKRERSPAVSQHVEIHRPTESTEKKEAGYTPWETRSSARTNPTIVSRYHKCKCVTTPTLNQTNQEMANHQVNNPQQHCVPPNKNDQTALIRMFLERDRSTRNQSPQESEGTSRSYYVVPDFSKSIRVFTREGIDDSQT
jgi:hypothetical protein